MARGRDVTPEPRPQTLRREYGGSQARYTCSVLGGVGAGAPPAVGAGSVSGMQAEGEAQS